MTQMMTIPKIAQTMGVSDNTIRRYIANYTEFFKPQLVDGWEQYERDEVIPVLKRIKEVSAAGRRRSEVIQIIEKEFDRVPERVSYKVDETMIPITNVIEFGPNTMAAIRDLTAAIERMYEQRKTSNK